MILGIELLIITIMSICFFYYLSWGSIEEKDVTAKLKKIPKQSSKPKWIFIILMTALVYATAIARFVLYNSNSSNAKELKLIIMLMMLIPLVWTDYHEHLIPNKLVLVGLVIRGLIYIFELVINFDVFFQTIKSDLIGAGFIIVVTMIGAVITKGGIGGGDVKLLGLMALFQGLSGMLMSVLVSLIIMFFFALYFLCSHKKSKRDVLPFAPAAFAGTLLSMILTSM